jgi:hypothetical protein
MAGRQHEPAGVPTSGGRAARPPAHQQAACSTAPQLELSGPFHTSHLGLRILGWVLLLMAFAIPSTLTLGLPLVALLALALAPIPEQVAGDGLAS